MIAESSLLGPHLQAFFSQYLRVQNELAPRLWPVIEIRSSSCCSLFVALAESNPPHCTSKTWMLRSS